MYLLCVHHTHYVYICMYTYSIILLIYIFPYINILYPPIILHTLLHSISIYILLLYNICILVYNNIQILSITIYITCIQYVNINSNIYIVYCISYTHTYVHHIVYIYTWYSVHIYNIILFIVFNNTWNIVYWWLLFMII